MNYVIIGNSVAAVGAIRGIRNYDNEGTITVLSRENHIAYGRPLISYLLGGTITEKRMAYLPDDFYEKQGVNLLLGAEVVTVDSDKKQVKLAAGDTIPFDKLLVATGGDPFVPPIEGLEGKGEGLYLYHLGRCGKAEKRSRMIFNVSSSSAAASLASRLLKVFIC